MHQSTSIDFLIRIKNGYKAGRKTILAPASNFCVAIAELLKKTGYIADFSVNDDVKKEMTIKLAYDNNEPRINDVQFIFQTRSTYLRKKFFPSLG